MAGRPRYIVADVPYLLDCEAVANDTAGAHMEQRRRPREDDCYEDDEDLALAYYGNARRGEDLRRVDRGLTSRDRGFYLPHDLGQPEPARRARPYHSPPPYDAADEELAFSRRRRPTNYPPTYDALDDESILEHERRGRFPRPGLTDYRLPFNVRDMGLDDLDGRSFRNMNPGPRNFNSRHGLRGSRDMGPDHLVGLEPRVRRGMEPRLDDDDDGFDMGPRGSRHGFGTAGVREAGRHRTVHRFEDDDIEGEFGKAPRGRRPHLAVHRSDLDFRCVNDDIEHGEFRAPTTAELRHQRFLAQMHDELDAEERDAEARERERREAQIEDRHTEMDVKMENTRHGLRNRRARIPRAAGVHPTDNSLDDDIAEVTYGRRGYAFRPRQTGNRQNLRANGNIERRRAYPPHEPPTYDSLTPTQVAARSQAKANRRPITGPVAQSANPQHVAAAVPSNTETHPVEKVVAAITADEEISHGQRTAQAPIDQANNGGSARHGAGSRTHAAPPPRSVTRGLSADSAHTSRAEVGDNGFSDSCDSDSDTPGEGSETAGARDDSLTGDEVLQSFVHIAL